MSDQEKVKNKIINLDGDDAGCPCTDPFGELPAALLPKTESPMRGLRQLNCPQCGLKFWTNRTTELCLDCEKKK
jgi:hypothetical protein